MVFVGNDGVVQIHTGPIHTVRSMGPWLNVLDPGFNLHLREDLIAHAWVVKKPTSDGVVTSLELFDAKGHNIAMLFGARKPGAPERQGWRELITGVQAVGGEGAARSPLRLAAQHDAYRADRTVLRLCRADAGCRRRRAADGCARVSGSCRI
jgi:hypothetical protein